jgi:hypothetical protein
MLLQQDRIRALEYSQLACGDAEKNARTCPQPELLLVSPPEKNYALGWPCYHSNQIRPNQDDRSASSDLALVRVQRRAAHAAVWRIVEGLCIGPLSVRTTTRQPCDCDGSLTTTLFPGSKPDLQACRATSGSSSAIIVDHLVINQVPRVSVEVHYSYLRSGMSSGSTLRLLTAIRSPSGVPVNAGSWLWWLQTGPKDCSSPGLPLILT